MSLDEVLAAIANYPTRLVEITGGEPLEQDEAYALMNTLLESHYTVMLETGGHIAVDRVPKAVIHGGDRVPQLQRGSENYEDQRGNSEPT